MTIADRFTAHFVPGDEVASAENAVQEIFPDLGSQTSAVDVARLAKNLGIDVKYEANDGFDGCLSWDDSGKARIMVSTRGSRTRQRFTLAHELGHWIIQRKLLGDMSEPLFRGVSTSREEVKHEERLANLLAAEILLPRAAVVNSIGEKSFGLDLIQYLTRTYHTSRMAAIRRVADLSKRPLVYLNVVPMYFDDLESIAEVDEAVYFRPRSGTLAARESTRLQSRVSFQLIASSSHVQLKVVGVDGVFDGRFDVQYRDSLVPNCDLLAVQL